MNLLLFDESDVVSEGRIKVSGRRFLHLITVLKSTVGSSVKLGMIDDGIGNGIIEELDDSSALIKYVIEEPSPPKKDIILVLAMCRPKSFRRALFYSVCMGVPEIHVIRSWRVEKSFFESPVLDSENINETSILALEQAKDTILPEVIIHKLFRPFAEDILPSLSQSRKKILCHPYSDEILPSSISEPAILAIGPEGGFIDYEINMLKFAGFVPYTMGNRILTTENAVAAALGRITL